MANKEPAQKQRPLAHAGARTSASASTRLASLLWVDWFTVPRFALLLGLLIAASFPEVLVGAKSFVVRDFGFFAYPLAHFQRECFWRGEMPLWNPYNNCGVPFLAQWNTMPLYPPALIYLLGPLTWSLNFFCLIHLFFAGMGMYFLARRWSGNHIAAGLAGVVFAFNGLSLNMLMWPSHIATLAWMPWVVLLAEKAWLQGGRNLFAAALAGAMQMLAGGPETIMLTWLLVVALWCVQIFQGFRQPNAISRAMLWRLPLVVLLVACLSAAQLLPFLDLVANSQRHQGYADTRWSMPGWGWANFLVPMVFGQIWSMGVFFQYNQAWTSSYYLGLGAVLLAPLAFLQWRNLRVSLLAAAAFCALLLAFGDQTFVYTWLRTLVPQLSFITYPIKFVTLVVFAVPLLLAFSMATLDPSAATQNKQLVNRLIGLALLLLAFIALILVWATRFPFPTDNLFLTLRSGATRAVLLISFTFFLWRFLHKTAPAWPLLLLCWVDLFTHVPSQNPTVSTWVYTPGLARMKVGMQPQPELGASRAMVSPFAGARFISFVSSSAQDNFLVKRLGYFADCNLLDNVPKTDGFFSLYPRHCGELNAVLYGATNASYPRIEDFMSVSQITAPGAYFEWSPRPSYLPLITAGQSPTFADDPTCLRLLAGTNFHPGSMVLLPAELQSQIQVTNGSRARVTSSRIQPQRIEVEAAGEQPFFVVLSMTYYHRWRAYVDGKPAKVLRANYAFQSVEIPAGHHRLILRYEDHAFWYGVALSAVTLLLCGAGWWRAGGGNDARNG